MKIKTAELTGAALDWAVAKCEGIDLFETEGWFYSDGKRAPFRPSTKWEQGGPIIERERIELKPTYAGWAAFLGNKTFANGPTSLIAAMRCYVANKIGDEVAIPEELLK